MLVTLTGQRVIQLFRKRLSTKAYKCTPQPQKVMWVVFKSRFLLTKDFREIGENIAVRTRHCECHDFIHSFHSLKFID